METFMEFFCNSHLNVENRRPLELFASVQNFSYFFVSGNVFLKAFRDKKYYCDCVSLFISIFMFKLYD